MRFESPALMLGDLRGLSLQRPGEGQAVKAYFIRAQDQLARLSVVAEKIKDGRDVLDWPDSLRCHVFQERLTPDDGERGTSSSGGSTVNVSTLLFSSCRGTPGRPSLSCTS